MNDPQPSESVPAHPTWREWLQRAFAIPQESEFQVTDAERRAAELVCRLIADRGLITPALIFLESFRPLNYVTAQSLHFFTPFIASLADPAAFEHFARMLERPGSVEYLCTILERLAKPADSG